MTSNAVMLQKIGLLRGLESNPIRLWSIPFRFLKEIRQIMPPVSPGLLLSWYLGYKDIMCGEPNLRIRTRGYRVFPNNWMDNNKFWNDYLCKTMFYCANEQKGSYLAKITNVRKYCSKLNMRKYCSLLWWKNNMGDIKMKTEFTKF